MTVVEIILGAVVIAVFAWRKCAEAERDLLRQIEAHAFAERMADRPAPRFALIYKTAPKQPADREGH